MIKTKKQMYLVIGAFALVMLLGGVTYAFFNYTRTGTANTIRTGRIYFITSQDGTINLTNVFPIASNEVSSINDQVTVRIQGDTTYANGEEYEISLVSVNNTIISGSTEKVIPVSYVASYTGTPVATGETANVIGTSSNNYFSDRESTTAVYKLNTTGEVSEGEQVLIGYIPKDVAIDGTLTIKAYLDSSKIAISDTYNDGNTPTDNMGTPASFGEGKTVLTTTEWNALQNTETPLSFKIKAVSQEGTWVEEPLQAEKLTADFSSRTVCMKKVDLEDAAPYHGTLNEGKVVYYMNDDESCLKNYVWYSGKLWRITAIYPDGKMKLVTENPITIIQHGDTNYKSSSTKEWINEVFVSTLYNKEDILVENGEWNGLSTTNATTNPYTAVNSNYIFTATAGLLNAYEYIMSLGTHSYLNIGQSWWLMTPYGTTAKVWYVIPQGDIYNVNDVSYVNGVRPSIYLQSSVVFSSGQGTRSDPYKIKGDKSIAVNDSDLIDRTDGINGEYVKFDNDLYRIIGLEGTTTKIVKVDYINDNDEIVKKKYAPTEKFSTLTSSDDGYWNYWLTNTWFNDISQFYQRMIATNTTGTINLAGKYYNKTVMYGSYKNAIDNSNSYYSKVGLLRYGEMFAAQMSLDTHINSLGSYSDMWTSTPYTSNRVWYVNSAGIGSNYGYTSSNLFAARPTLNLKSAVQITCNSGNTCDGTYFHPYDLVCTTCDE